METRREFLKKLGLAGAALSAPGAVLSFPPEASMPKRKLGKMGFQAGILAFGTAELPVGDMELCERMLALALDKGVNYIDTAPSYLGTKAEQAVGRVSKRRKEFFLATKTLARDKAGALAEVEASLKRLNTDHIDLLQVHSVNDTRNLDAALREGGAVEGLEEAKKQGKIRHIGITGHTRPAVILDALKRYAFESILVPVSAADFHINDFAAEVVPRAQKMGISIAGMKSLKGWSLAGGSELTAAAMLRYSLSLPICTLTCGMTSVKQVQDNLAAALGFHPLSSAEVDRMREVAKGWADVQHLWWKRT